MTLMQLKCFWTVGTTGSFTEAAETLYITQSAVSKNIAILEQELMFPLFNRSGKAVTLSSSGKRMLEFCSKIIEMQKSMEAEAVKIRRGLSYDNQIRLASVPPMATYGVIGRINDFGMQNSDFEVIVEETDEDRVLFLLQSGGCDIAFCSNIKLNDKYFNILKICHEDFSAIFSKDHEFAGKTDLQLADLRGQRFIFSKQESMLYDLCYNACVEAGFNPTVIMRTSSLEISMQYVLDHRCLCMGLTSVLNKVSSSEHCVRHIAGSPGFDYVLCWKKSEYTLPALQNFIGYFKRSKEL
jgi:DNA-binding transcriptional LysR family regulator